jgi:hypothetical protein
MNRRDLIVWSGSAFCAKLTLAQAAGLPVSGYERGDPTADSDPAYYPSAFLESLQKSNDKKIIPDPIPDFPKRLLELAITFKGVNRWDNSWTKIRDMLAVFGCPFDQVVNGKKQYTAFCAAGISYCACTLYAKTTELGDLQSAINVVDFHSFWPSPAVWKMVQVANAKGRWKAAGPGVLPRAGWIVCYDWTATANLDAVDHCGVVIDADKSTLHTLEFNTSGSAGGSQRNGGVVLTRERSYNSLVKGFIVTDSMDK